jgi:hypothetical protein
LARQMPLSRFLVRNIDCNGHPCHDSHFCGWKAIIWNVASHAYGYLLPFTPPTWSRARSRDRYTKWLPNLLHINSQNIVSNAGVSAYIHT